MRHELEHIKKNHASIKLYYAMANNQREIDYIYPTERQQQAIARALETEADLMPLVYAPLQVAKDNEELWRVELNTLLHHNIAGRANKHERPSIEKRSSRAIIIRKIKDAECS